MQGTKITTLLNNTQTPKPDRLPLTSRLRYGLDLFSLNFFHVPIGCVPPSSADVARRSGIGWSGFPTLQTHESVHCLTVSDQCPGGADTHPLPYMGYTYRYLGPQRVWVFERIWSEKGYSFSPFLV